MDVKNRLGGISIKMLVTSLFRLLAFFVLIFLNADKKFTACRIIYILLKKKPFFGMKMTGAQTSNVKLLRCTFC